MGGRRSVAWTARLALGLLATSLVSLPRVGAEATPKLPKGFTDSLVATVFLPTALAFLPDGRLRQPAGTPVRRRP